MAMEPRAPEAATVRRFAGMLRQAHRVVAFTGAGMSTESGLPDFRSAGGLWKQSRRFEELASVDALEHEYAEFVEFYRWRIRMLRSFRPNAGHEILAQWQRQGRVHRVVTQNVDGFHERAGSTDVLLLHGTLRRVHCVECGRSQSSDAFLEPEGTRCSTCRGKMRPSVVLFGEALDSATLHNSFQEVTAADLVIVLGSSLVVSPANLLPEAAAQAGAQLAIVNRERTLLSHLFHMELRASIGPTLKAMDRALG
ncbi:MAG: NAD-dependent deacylase [Polyangiaceae bacterium]|nr:NAD-dependent deacylase [Polyangiaceae bacterium]